MYWTERASTWHERITDIYIITIFFVYLLFPGFSGYRDITKAKFLFLMAATGLWLLLLTAALLWERPRFPRPGPAFWAMAGFMAVCLLSWALSPWRAESLLGAGRYDGLLSELCYALGFLGVALFTRPRRVHAVALAAGTALCCLVAALQLFGLDPLRLFPVYSGGRYLNYYDAGLLYSGAYLGTVGNTNILDAVLCCALPLSAALYIRGEGPLFLAPLVPGVFVLAAAGGAGAALAAACVLLILPPLTVTDRPRLRRALFLASAILAASALAKLWQPLYAAGTLLPRFDFSPFALCLLAGSAAALGLGLALPERYAPPARMLRRCFLLMDGAAALGGAALLWFWPGDSGTMYELHSALHGQLDDSFGSSRIMIWRACLGLVPERPLLGGGPGTLALRLELRFSRYVAQSGVTLSSYVDNAHNVWLARLVNCGALGLAALAAALGFALADASRRMAAPMTAGLCAAVAGGAVHGCFGLGLCLSEPFFWIPLALLCSAKEVLPCSTTDTPPPEPGSSSRP